MFRAYTRVTNFDQIFAVGTGGRLIRVSVLCEYMGYMSVAVGVFFLPACNVINMMLHGK